ncbi:NAD-dependent epimerase/dehydratase family protein [Streptomyces sp. NPDC001193]
MQKILVIGGSRYFGKHLVTLLRDAGDEVTVLNRGSAAPPPGVGRGVADRDDEGLLREALGDRTFDTVVDQVCYTPLQAAVARRVFAGRTERYVMTSTMEVYDPAPPTAEARAYAEGKRRAEAVLREPGRGGGPFAFAAVRTAHVLGGGREEFTGRLAHYTGRIAAGTPGRVAGTGRVARVAGLDRGRGHADDEPGAGADQCEREDAADDGLVLLEGPPLGLPGGPPEQWSTLPNRSSCLASGSP